MKKGRVIFYYIEIAVFEHSSPIQTDEEAIEQYFYIIL
jgi:hypothetical protein